MNWESIYTKLPVTLQKIAVNLEGWRIERQRYNSGYDRIYQEVWSRESLSGEELHKYQENRLREVLENAQKNSPYYKELFEKHSFDIDTPNLIERLKELPKRVGDDMEIVINYVDTIERTQTGKLRFVVSELKQGKLL